MGQEWDGIVVVFENAERMKRRGEERIKKVRGWELPREWYYEGWKR
jgi:hypothetical protein